MDYIFFISDIENWNYWFHVLFFKIYPPLVKECFFHSHQGCFSTKIVDLFSMYYFLFHYYQYIDLRIKANLYRLKNKYIFELHLWWLIIATSYRLNYLILYSKAIHPKILHVKKNPHPYKMGNTPAHTMITRNFVCRRFLYLLTLF